MDGKYCTKCLEDKPLSEFHKCSSNPDGLQYRCKACSKEATTASRAKRNPEVARNIKKAWYQANREISLERAKLYRQNHPEWAKEMNAKHSGSWREKYPEKAKALTKRQAFQRKLRKYSLTPEQFQEMHDKQEGKCAICQVVPTDGLVIDHNHTTNKVRELLCNRCNPAVGMIGENPDVARRIIEYLAKHSGANGIDSPSVRDSFTHNQIPN